MAPSDTPNSGLRQVASPNTEQEILAQSTSDRSSKPESKEKKSETQKEPKPKDLTKEGKLTGAELKRKAKEEKAAKRARDKEEKQGQQLPGAGPLGIGKADVASQAEKKGGEVLSRDTPALPKNQQQKQQKQPSSSTADAQKPLEFRPSGAFPSLAIPEPIGENKEVALFGHLYGKARRVTIAGAVKGVHPAVLALGLKMSNYVICGSNARCVSTLIACKLVIKSYITPPQNSIPRHLTVHIKSQIDYLASCRPLSVSTGNAIRWLKVVISAVDPSTSESQAKADLCSDIDNYIEERITLADRVIVESAMGKICDGDVILTYAKSSIVQRILTEAFRHGKKFQVVVVDSRPLFEGKNLARALGDLGLDVHYTLTQGISHAIKNATKVFLGAHAMLSNGRLYSRVGTAIVAMTAKDASIPVLVCCESIKFTDHVALDSFVTNEVAPPDELIMPSSHPSALSNWRETTNLQLLNLMYDLTPADYIDMVISEHGDLQTVNVPEIYRLITPDS